MQKTRIYNVDDNFKYREKDGEWVRVAADMILWRGFVSAIMSILISIQQGISWPKPVPVAARSKA